MKTYATTHGSVQCDISEDNSSMSTRVGLLFPQNPHTVAPRVGGLHKPVADAICASRLWALSDVFDPGKN